MFAGFHHFRPDAAQAILTDAFQQRSTLCIFESGQGTLLGIIMLILLVPVNVLILMPFARPFRWAYLVFTYLIPIIPLVIVWDGIVSNLRIYSPERMEGMTRDLTALDYVWEIGRIKVRGLPEGMPYSIGRPAVRTIPETSG